MSAVAPGAVTTAGRRTKVRASGKAKPQKRDSLLSQLLLSSDGRAFIVGLRAAGAGRLTPIDAVTPPGSLLDAVIRTVREKTDLPPEIGLAVCHSAISSALAQTGSTVAWPDNDKDQELAMWLLVLAPSGSGKTLIRNLVIDALGVEARELPDAGSARAFLNALSEVGGTASWVRDEYGQMIKQIADGGPMAGVRDYLLRAYDHAKLEVTTVSAGETVVEHPVLSIFGATVDSTWKDCIDPSMLGDGLLARHLFIVAERRALSVPRFPMQEMKNIISEAARELRPRLAEKARYRITLAAAAVYDDLWKDTVGKIGSGIDPAYFRRVTWSVGRYAVVYHLLLDKQGRDVGVEAMRWAWRMTMLHLEYARQVLAISDAGFAPKLERILAWVEQQAAAGVDVTTSSFVRALCKHFPRDLSSASEARQLIDLARKSSKSAENMPTRMPQLL